MSFRGHILAAAFVASALASNVSLAAEKRAANAPAQKAAVTARAVEESENLAAPAEQTRLGLRLRTLASTPRGKNEPQAMLVVESVRGPAEKAGIRAGDQVLSLNGAAINSMEHFRRVLSQAKSRVALVVRRGDKKIFIPVAPMS
jgi:serine protease Do